MDRSLKLWLTFVIGGGIILLLYVGYNWSKYPEITYESKVDLYVKQTWVNHGAVLMNDSVYAPGLSKLVDFPDIYAKGNFGLPDHISYKNIRISQSHISTPYHFKKEANSAEFILIKDLDTLYFVFEKK